MAISMKKYTGSGNAGGSFLHGSDVADKDQIIIHCNKVREARGLNNAAFVMDIEPIGSNGATVWAVNRTNANLLAEIFFADEDDPDAEQLAGKDIVLDVIEQNNPQTDQIVPSLLVSASQKVKGVKGAKRGK